MCIYQPAYDFALFLNIHDESNSNVKVTKKKRGKIEYSRDWFIAITFSQKRTTLCQTSNNNKKVKINENPRTISCELRLEKFEQSQPI